MPGRNEAVAAVIAGPGYDRDLAAGRIPSHDGFCDGAAGVLHQDFSSDAGRDGTAIRLAHLRIGEKFQHRSNDNNSRTAAATRVLLKIVHGSLANNQIQHHASGTTDGCLLTSQCA
jgi:hypothetical protein